MRRQGSRLSAQPRPAATPPPSRTVEIAHRTASELQAANCALTASDGFYVRGSLVSGRSRRASASRVRISRASSRFRAGEPGVSIATERRRFSTSSDVSLSIAPEASEQVFDAPMGGGRGLWAAAGI